MVATFFFSPFLYLSLQIGPYPCYQFSLRFGTDFQVCIGVTFEIGSLLDVVPIYIAIFIQSLFSPPSCLLAHVILLVSVLR